MQSTNRPSKFLVPFAQNDSARVELPATTADATRASQSLGFPPATGLPPEAGGVPPQLEDMNGGLNQISRGVWWALGGGRYPYDSTWANDALIGGYARGAVVPAALGAGQIGLGDWYNNTEANTANPDTDGTGWVPGYQYGATALTGQTGGTMTLTPAQAAKRVITVAGTLTSNLVLVVPTWVYDWTVYNNTGGAFTVTIKNAATAGVVIPQNGAATPIRCDGAACSAWSPNVAAATLATQPLQLGQAIGRYLGFQVFAASGTYTPTAGAKTIQVEAIGGGGGGGGCAGTTAAQQATSFGGVAGSYALVEFPVDANILAGVAVTVGAAGAGATAGANSGGAGGNTTFGTRLSVAGGAGGGGGAGNGSGAYIGNRVRSFTAASATGGSILKSVLGADGSAPMALSVDVTVGGAGGSTLLGTGGLPITNQQGNPGAGRGAGGAGGSRPQSQATAIPGAAGTAGIVIVYEYS